MKTIFVLVLLLSVVPAMAQFHDNPGHSYNGLGVSPPRDAGEDELLPHYNGEDNSGGVAIYPPASSVETSTPPTPFTPYVPCTHRVREYNQNGHKLTIIEC